MGTIRFRQVVRQNCLDFCTCWGLIARGLDWLAPALGVLLPRLSLCACLFFRANGVLFPLELCLCLLCVIFANHPSEMFSRPTLHNKEGEGSSNLQQAELCCFVLLQPWWKRCKKKKRRQNRSESLRIEEVAKCGKLEVFYSPRSEAHNSVHFSFFRRNVEEDKGFEGSSTRRQSSPGPHHSHTLQRWGRTYHIPSLGMKRSLFVMIAHVPCALLVLCCFGEVVVIMCVWSLNFKSEISNCGTFIIAVVCSFPRPNILPETLTHPS